MSISMKLWKVAEGKLVAYPSDKLDKEDRLEAWISQDSSILGLNILPIGRQVLTGFGGRIDLLGIDGSGALVVLELKRDKTPRDIVSQVLDYASWAKDLSLEQITNISKAFLNKGLEVAFRDWFGSDLPEAVNLEQRMVIVASELDKASERIVQYLSDKWGVDINVIFFNFFKNDSEELIGRSWLIDPRIVEDKKDRRIKGPWSGYWYVNIDGNWDDCRHYGFLSAGGGKKYSDPFQKLNIGDKIFAYLKNYGYVGYGVIEREVLPVTEFTDNESGKSMMELPLKESPQFRQNQNDHEKLDYLVGVKWMNSVPKSEAKTFKGVFANQNIVCKLRDTKTLDFLQEKFQISEE